jgi:hypothetical protein
MRNIGRTVAIICLAMIFVFGFCLWAGIQSSF